MEKPGREQNTEGDKERESEGEGKREPNNVRRKKRRGEG
jgi:hypothetical protein